MRRGLGGRRGGRDSRLGVWGLGGRGRVLLLVGVGLARGRLRGLGLVRGLFLGVGLGLRRGGWIRLDYPTATDDIYMDQLLMAAFRSYTVYVR